MSGESLQRCLLLIDVLAVHHRSLGGMLSIDITVLTTSDSEIFH